MKVFFTGCFILIPFFSFGQKTDYLHELEQKLIAADSIWIVSHEATAGIQIKDEKTGKISEPAPILVKNKPNFHIIKEVFRVKGENRDSLVKILTREVNQKVISQNRCFIPHHSILIFEKNKIALIEICFGCKQIHCSEDIKIWNGDFDAKKWIELKIFFEKNGLNHEFEY